MAIEIERKFLLTSDSWKQNADAGTLYRQGYLTEAGDRASVRVRISGDQARLNIKSATLGVYRREYEYAVPLADAAEMLEELCGSIVEKVRYLVRHGQHTWEVDVFSGANDGLVVAEIELGSEDEAFERPDWLGDEVSDDFILIFPLSLPVIGSNR